MTKFLSQYNSLFLKYELIFLNFRRRGRRDDYSSSSSSSSSEGDSSDSSGSSDAGSDAQTATTSGEVEDGRYQIVGGVAVARGNVPWQVNLGGVGVMCGGTIVAMDVS